MTGTFRRETPMQALLWLFIIAGHLGIWCAIFNRTHATAWPRSWRKLVELAAIAVTGGPLAGLLAVFLARGPVPAGELADRSDVALAYLTLCCAVAGWFGVVWLYRTLTHRQPARIARNGSEWLNPEQTLGLRLTNGWMASLLRLVPGNQVVGLSEERFTIGLAPEGDAGEILRVVQLSDLHFTGLVRREFFEFAVQRANQFRPDLVVITGDIIDEQDCFDWIVPVLGKLEAPLGVWYVLGNHDRRIADEGLLRHQLAAAGLRAAAGAWHDLVWRGRTIRLTGNELPWYGRDSQLENEPVGVPVLKLLLAHSPDQIEWAVDRSFDLVLAGHTHGGQIQLPLIGPVICPSKYGVRFAGGDFEVGGVLMHVSRGLSGDDPIRWNCPPELGLFELRLPAPPAGSPDVGGRGNRRAMGR